MIEFKEVISIDRLLQLYEVFHEEMTGEVGYRTDENGMGNPWWDFRKGLILAGRRGLIEEKGENK